MEWTVRQIPTRYAPVRHFACPRTTRMHIEWGACVILLGRSHSSGPSAPTWIDGEASHVLACVEHIASVRSEPGSNSFFSITLCYFEHKTTALSNASKAVIPVIRYIRNYAIEELIKEFILLTLFISLFFLSPWSSHSSSIFYALPHPYDEFRIETLYFGTKSLTWSMKVRGGPLPYLRAARILDLPMVDRALKPSFGRVEIENRAILPVILYICNNTRFVILCDPKALNSCLFYAVSIEIAYPIPVISLPPHQLIPQGELRWTTACPGKEKGDSIQPQITADFVWAGFYYERTGSPDQSQYIWRKTISHIEVVLGSGVFPVLQWCPPGMTFQIFVPANGLFLRASMGTHWTRFDWQLYVPFHSLKEVSASHSWYM